MQGEKQFTEAEIKKALECCKTDNCGKHCPFYEYADCMDRLDNLLLDLINRKNAENDDLQNQLSIFTKLLDKAEEKIEEKNAEIERLNGIVAYQKDEFERLHITYDRVYEDRIKQARAEAIKEFAERVKEKYKMHFGKEWNAVYNPIDQIAKEMGVEL